MHNYKSYIELANSEVRALESYNNFQIFLDESNEYAMESMSAFKESSGKMKDRIVRFFKMLFGAIYRFFVKILGKEENLAHKRAFILVIDYINDTKSKIDKIADMILKEVRNPNTEKDISNEIIHLHDEIKEDGENTKDKIHDMVTNNRNKHEYTLINKSKMEFINTFAKDCEQTLTKTVDTLESENSNNNQHIYYKGITIPTLLNTVSTASHNVMHLVQSAMWHSRVEDNETKLKNPITIEVED